MDDDAEIIAEFLVESHENLDQLDRDLVALEQDPGSREKLASIFRTIHTIKGTSGFLGFGHLESLTHVGENLLSRLRDGEMLLDAELTGTLLRMVDTVRDLLAVIERTGADETADAVVVAEVVAALKAALEPATAPSATQPPATQPPAPEPVSAPEPTVTPDQPSVVPLAAAPTPVAPQPVPEPTPVAVPTDAAADPGDDEPGTRSVVDSSVRVDVNLLDNLVQLVGELVLTRNQILQRTDGLGDAELVRAAQRLDLVASELQEGVMQTRMQPIGQVWAKMPRIVRDLAAQLGREVHLEMEGHDTELDRSLLEALKGPLTHLVRNSLDHGIEPPERRIAAGKAAAGRLSLRARHESGQVVVEITDDGAGIDPVRVAETAIARGVITADQAARMEPKELVQLVFRPGFSTAATVTNVSGRGVGMDVVRTNIERIGGSVDLSSQVGLGTTCRVRIPLTLAIIPALVVGEGGERYAIPQANLVELVRLEGEDLRNGVEMLAGSPVLRLRGHLLPLVALTTALGGPSSATDGPLTVVVVQADGSRFGLCIEEVYDTQEIVVKPIGRQLKGLATYAGATIMGDGRVALILDVPGIAATAGIDHVVADEPEPKPVDDDAEALLVLEVAAGRRAALPLRAISRLEEFDPARVERSGNEEVVQYRDGILPLVRLAPAIGLRESELTGDQLSVVVHEADGRRVGIIIDRVLDVVETAVVRSEVGRRTGVLGSAIVQDRVTDLVDLEAVVGR
ncbi:chemotaxis protein CheA [Nocardioides daejeonensis]|uniref:chemotaxis protein CheA n=1 Tax=Nocardioides daejeonensis TaxID=1046556 RepID=UPI000D74C460|nr:chemotaxis protein CheA [Nocardioides daejeonensis]